MLSGGSKVQPLLVQPDYTETSIISSSDLVKWPTAVLYVVYAHLDKGWHRAVLPLTQTGQTAAKHQIWRHKNKNSHKTWYKVRSLSQYEHISLLCDYLRLSWDWQRIQSITLFSTTDPARHKHDPGVRALLNIQHQYYTELYYTAESHHSNGVLLWM